MESLILGKHVIEQEIYKKKLIDCKYFFTYGYDGVATRVSSLDTVKKAFQKKNFNKDLRFKKKILDDYFGPIDGKCKMRFFKIINQRKI